MGGGNPFEQQSWESDFKDWREYDIQMLSANNAGSPSTATASKDRAIALPHMDDQFERHTWKHDNEDHWLNHHVNVNPAAIIGPSTPILVNGQDKHTMINDPLNLVSSPPSTAAETTLENHDNINFKPAEQSMPMSASLFGFSSIGLQSTSPHYFSSPSYIHHSMPPAPATCGPVAFQLMNIVSDKQDLSFVEKVQVLEAQILMLCNILGPASAKGKDNVITSIDFDALNSQTSTVIGFYGERSILRRIIVERNLAPPSFVTKLHANSLTSGLYACLNGDGKALEEVTIDTVNSMPKHRQRTQRVQVSMRKESENDLKLHKGFEINLSADECSNPLMVGLAQGAHRCLVLGGALTKPKLVPQRDHKTDTTANLRAWIASKAAEFSLDCSQLNKEEFLLLLEVLDKQEELKNYRQAEDVQRQKQLEANNALQSLDSIMKAKKASLLSASHGAMECLLLQRNPWEEGLLNADKNQEKSQPLRGEDSKHPASSLSPLISILEYEGRMCGVWSDQDNPGQRFLFSGSIVEIASVKVDGNVTKPGSRLFSIGLRDVQNAAVGKGPICFGQQLILTGKSAQNHTDCLQECIGYFSKEGCTLMHIPEPVILNGDTKLILNLSVRRPKGELVIVRHADSGDPGIITWLETFCKGPMSLHQNAAALSHLMSKLDSKCFDDKMLEKLLQEPLKKWLEKLLQEPLKKWLEMQCLPSEATSIIMEFLSEKQEKVISIQGKIAAICSGIYRAARHKSWMAVEAFVTNNVYPAIREKLQKQLQKQTATVQEALKTDAKTLLSGMKAKLFASVENSSGEIQKKRKLSVLKIQVHKSFVDSLRSFLIRADSKITISYSYEELETQRLAWKAIEMVPQKADLDEVARMPSSRGVVVPVRGINTELIALNPTVERLSGVVMVKQGHLLVFVETVDKTCLHLYLYPKLGGSQMGTNPVKTFRRGLDLWAFDEVSRFLAMYDKKANSIKSYRFDENYQHMDWAGDIQLSSYSGSSNILWMALVPGKREILLVDDDNRLRMCEVVSSMMRAKQITLPNPIIKACVTPDAACLIVICMQVSADISQMDANKEYEHAYDSCSPTGSSKLSALVFSLDDSLTFLRCLPLDTMDIGQNAEQMHVTCKYFGTQMQLVFLSSRIDGTALMSYVVEISSAQQTFQLQKVGSQLSQGEHNTEQNSQQSSNVALDYIFHVFDKYATSPPLCSTERNLGLCVLLNPPCQNWENSKAKKNCEDLVASSLRKLKKKGKVFKSLRLDLSIETLEDTSHVEESQAVQNAGETVLGTWIQKLLCLVPLQIARAENNTLKPMVNGLQIPANATYSDAVSLASLLRFGPYDLMLAGWKGQVKVISSMGKQSSGKSYLLNHLAGSLLDVAGGRCTDGVWMTIRCESDCLYVLLDFEGLGSFERSEQEDMFLSILNAAISNITIFNKKDFHLDKETEAIFQRFQDGVSLVKADEKLFKGLFYLAIKDVDAADVEDLKAEFIEKIHHICSKSTENFLVTMYNGEACVAALPPFQRPDFQESIADIGLTIQEISASYSSGRRFMEDFKLVLSQISARDWSSVDSRRVVMRLSNLRSHLESAIRLGQCCDGQDLIDFDKDESIKDNPISFEEVVCNQIEDAGLELAGNVNDSSGMQIILEPLKQKFESIVQRSDNTDKKWHGMYQSFLHSLMERRRSRVLEWLEVNTADFKQDADMQKLVLEVSTKLADMKNKLLLCSCKCSICFLSCILLKGHYSDHSCLGSHSCMQECSYCAEERALSGRMVLECDDLAGHNGPHDCKKRTHTCEKPCLFANSASNCNKKCSSRVDHPGDHRCNSLQHLCMEKCSLHGCDNACIMPFELGKHAQHACHEKFCPMQCSMEGCTRTCVTQDHFHDLKAGVQHFCASEHPCPVKCESPGVCSVHTELLRQTRSFHGKRSDFEYDYVSEQSEDRKGCCMMIPPFMRSHPGLHTHSTNANVVHYCDIRCPACDYYCQLPFGHAGLHKTVHGNMRKMRFVAEVEEIDVQDRKYVRGESGVAEMCMMHCKARGRGHTHLAPCPEKEGTGCCTEKLYDGARHLNNTKCEGLDVKTPLDEMTHQTFWEYIRFVDPCEEAEKESFALCNHLCRSEAHDTDSSYSGKSFCTEKLWHTPVQRAGAIQTGAGGYVTEDGHHFTCNHAKISPHNVIFVMDKSGSMECYDIKPTMAMFQQSGHQNRLGCIYEAVLRFIKMRMQTTSTTGLQVEDSVSVVLFDNYGRVSVKLEQISEDVINGLLHYRASGGTTYSSGLQMAEQILSESRRQPDLDKKGPVIIFLSDGGNGGGTDPVYMVQKLKQQEPRLVVHTIMFGNDPYAKVLQDMAKAGDGTYQLSLDEVQLARSFEGLAKSLQPKLAALCSLS